MKKLLLIFGIIGGIGTLSAYAGHDTSCPDAVFFFSQAAVDQFILDYPECTTITGNVVISGDVNNLSALHNITTITGALIINSESILTNLEGLESLVSVGTNVNLMTSSLADISQLTSLQSIGTYFLINQTALSSLQGLSSLASIGEGLLISGNTLLTSLDGLSSLSSIGEGLDIVWNPVLTNLDALSALTSVRNLTISGNPELTDISGLAGIDPAAINTTFGITIAENPQLSVCSLPNLCTYLGNLGNNRTIYGNLGSCATDVDVRNACGFGDCPEFLNLNTQTQVDQFAIDYPNCTAIAGDVYIGTAVTNLNALSNITEIGGYLIIIAPTLTSLNGLESLKSVGQQLSLSSPLTNADGLSALESVGQQVVVNGTSLPHLNGLASLKSIGRELDIQNNPLLTNLDGLANLESIGRELVIQNNAELTNITGLENIDPATISGVGLQILDNPKLSFCHLPNFCDFLSRPGILKSISGNLGDCFDESAVTSACVSNTAIQILVEAWTGQTFTLDVTLGDAIHQVKQKIEDDEGIPSGLQQLLFGNTVLENTQTIGHYNIQNGSTLKLIKRVLADESGIVYVDKSVATPGNGDTWENALPYLSDAIQSAKTNTTIREIHVAAGTYYPTGEQSGTNRDSSFVILRGGLKLFGGYPNGGGVRNFVTNKTVLSGNINETENATDNSYHVLVVVGVNAETDDIIVDGFTLQDGYADGQDAIQYSGHAIAQSAGGGIYSRQNDLGSRLRLANLIVQNNYAEHGAGMINQLNSSPRLINCTFSGNAALYNGGGISNMNASSPAIIHCTIAGNRAASGGGIYNVVSSSPAIQNTVVFGNSSGVFFSGNSEPTFAYSLVQGQPAGGSGNVAGNKNPYFVDPVPHDQAPTSTGNYRLQACSPAINRADDSLIPEGITLDLDGNARSTHGLPDLGAYEFQDELPAGSATLALHQDESTETISGKTSFFGNDEACRLITRLEPTGSSPVSGLATAKVEIDPEVLFHNGSPYVQRHYVINVQNGESAKVTLFFSQEEFTSFNEELPEGQLPEDANDELSKSNLRVYQYRGAEGSAPADYDRATLTVINPDDADIAWNETNQRWEVSFEVDGFSGFFVGSVASPLPVRLVSFSGSPDKERSVLLRWNVAEQHDIASYNVEYSLNGVGFEEAGIVEATVTQEATYTFRHTPLRPNGMVYYRLRIYETDGSHTLSQIISLRVDKQPSARAYPIPADQGFWIERQASAGHTTSLINMQGRVVKTWVSAPDRQYVEIRSLPSGLYFVRFDDGTSLKIIKK